MLSMKYQGDYFVSLRREDIPFFYGIWEREGEVVWDGVEELLWVLDWIFLEELGWVRGLEVYLRRYLR